ncbi:nuclear transport factor 2 family protein [Motilibacter aurantiacus]|uniref:nuclear transport factor 2 family protein n=1 Tax=Motilibacter aurantiacus TaxID=2714955 RepID=UPI0014090B96|nr:nuclear transport factor 2 family protein [Motilibacter aurantiacus]NHC47208.1 SnoaL-like domain-containing protein [Motilibacter aurantiacus]
MDDITTVQQATAATTGPAAGPPDLPAPVQDYLDAHLRGDVAAAAACFAPDAVVVDDGATYRGRAEITRWLSRTSSEYSYTTTLTGARRDGDRHWTVTQRLEGTFSGGVVVLSFAFVSDGRSLLALTIAPSTAG